MDAAASRRPRRRRASRLLRLAGKVALGCLVFLALLVTGALTALKLEGPRAYAARTVDDALSTTFRGRLRIVKLHALNLDGVRADVRVEDAAGRTVLSARNVDVRLGVASLLGGLVRRGGALERLDIDAVRIDHLEVRLVDDGTGVPSLAGAFALRAPTPPTTPSEPPPVVRIDGISLRHVWAHGTFGGAPWIDAELRHLAAALGVEPHRVAVRVSRAALVSRLGPHALDPQGTLAGSLSVPLQEAPLDAKAVFRGVVAEAPLDAKASYRGDRLDVHAVLPEVERKTLARFVPDSLPRGRVRAVVSATGPPEDLAVTAELGGELGTVRVVGSLRSPGDALRIEADLEARELDASAVVAGAPSTSVDLRSHVLLESVDADLTGRYEFVASRALVEGEAVPPPELRGTLEQSGERLVLSGQLRASEPGVDATARYEVTWDGKRGAADATVDATLDRPPRLKKLASIETSGTLSVRAHAAWPEPQLWARGRARLHALTTPDLKVGPASVELDARGPAAAPSGELRVKARAVAFSGLELRALSATLRGRPSRAELHAELESPHGQRARLRTMGSYSAGSLELADPTLALGDREGSVLVSARRVVVSPALVEAERVLLDGAGHAEASFSRRGDRTSADLRTERLDLARLARLARVPAPFRSLGATLQVTYDERPGARSATVRGNVTDVSYSTVQGGAASVELALKDDLLTGTLDTELVRGSRLVARLEDVAVLSPSAASGDVLGKVRVEGKLDLTGMSPLLTALPGFPVEKAGGSVELDVSYARERLDALPELVANVRTRHLSVVGRREAREVIDTSGEAIETEPPVYGGIDVSADIALSPETRRLDVDLGLFDRRGELLRLDARAGPWKGTTVAALAREAPDVPLEARAVVERRRLGQLPDMVRPLSLRGSVALEACLEGTARDPHVVVDVNATRLTTALRRVEGRVPPRLDVSALLDVRRAGGRVDVVAGSSGSRAGRALVTWSGDALRAASEPAALGALRARADLTLDRLDLAAIPALKNRQLGGILSGHARVEYSEEKRFAEVHLVARSVELGQAKLDVVDAKVRLGTDDMTGSVVARGDGGSLEAKLASHVRWPERSVPALDGGVRATLAAKHFRLASLWPLVSGSVNELDGRLDAELQATAEGDRVTLRGQGRLREGVVQIPSIGQRFSAIEADVAVEPSTIALRNLRARGVTGGLTGEATVRVDETLAMKELVARVRIDENRKIPVTLEGVALGDAYGTVEARLEDRPERTLLTIRMPEFHLDVPNADRLGVQDLGAAEGVRVGVRRRDAQFVALPVQPLVAQSEAPKPLVVTIELGRSVTLRQADLVTAELTGKLVATVAEETTVSGEIELRGGSLDVSGKRFDIERGTVRFSGPDPGNPAVFAMARWDSPAGYVVKARYVGTATDGKLTLSSEPPLQENEILNLILFGTPEGSGATGGGMDSAATAVSVAGGTAARGLNRVLHDFTKLDIQARVDTSTGAARPELVVPLTRRLSARVTRAIGEPTPGSSPDRTFLTLELRLRQKWALSALFGDRGASALDLIWRHHY